jgi:hypothetical protein
LIPGGRRFFVRPKRGEELVKKRSVIIGEKSGAGIILTTDFRVRIVGGR